MCRLGFSISKMYGKTRITEFSLETLQLEIKLGDQEDKRNLPFVCSIVIFRETILFYSVSRLPSLHTVGLSPGAGPSLLLSCASEDGQQLPASPLVGSHLPLLSVTTTMSLDSANCPWRAKSSLIVRDCGFS